MGREDRSWIVIIAVGMLGLAVLGLIAPRVLAWPLAFLLFWLGIASLIRGGDGAPFTDQEADDVRALARFIARALRQAVVHGDSRSAA